MKPISFGTLSTADLQVDAIYEGGRRGNAGDDPLWPLLRVSNSGGFRYLGTMQQMRMLVLTTRMADPDWPDGIDRETGIFTYYGDNKKAGQALHATPRRGNEILRNLFENAHAGRTGRERIPPIFAFATSRKWRDVEFLGLVVPGSGNLGSGEDLVAVWHTSAEKRFQNYRAKFTVLDAGTISREWVNNVVEGRDCTAGAPPAWRAWRDFGQYRPLKSRRSLPWRSKAEQQPGDVEGVAMIAAIQSHFSSDPHRFEHFAAAIVQMLLPDARDVDVTRPSRDGGRDGLGRLLIGKGSSSILVDFAIEAKCYASANSVGVREMSRLISRLRHRQFGVLVTTSFVDQQAYREIKEDEHPILVVSARDMVEVIRSNGRADRNAVTNWLRQEFALAKT